MAKLSEISRPGYEAYISKIASFIIIDNDVTDVESWQKIPGIKRSEMLYEIAMGSPWTAIIPACVATLRFTDHFQEGITLGEIAAEDKAGGEQIIALMAVGALVGDVLSKISKQLTS